MVENAFSILGMAVSFDVNLSDLEESYEKAQWSLHTGRTGSLVEKGVRNTALIAVNRAYATVKDPLSRARHILQLNGSWPVPEDPVLFDALLEWNGAGDQIQERYHQSKQDFSRAVSHQKWDVAQKAYWWMVRMRGLLTPKDQ